MGCNDWLGNKIDLLIRTNDIHRITDSLLQLTSWSTMGGKEKRDADVLLVREHPDCACFACFHILRLWTEDSYHLYIDNERMVQVYAETFIQKPEYRNSWRTYLATQSAAESTIHQPNAMPSLLGQTEAKLEDDTFNIAMSLIEFNQLYEVNDVKTLLHSTSHPVLSRLTTTLETAKDTESEEERSSSPDGAINKGTKRPRQAQEESSPGDIANKVRKTAPASVKDQANSDNPGPLPANKDKT
ncbi:Uu.00g001490.m01.CDS01 [Anthostomella pinea]|uniref:Uu.00g001490.m01.CDS01 n=1 Tax=Anthostomella pinea TaxID=933095 RepID=A0AAI8VJC8_9PEZI|nr:Uu.00g001490.m01.CDS01 [Anthostomella pinea]